MKKHLQLISACLVVAVISLVTSCQKEKIEPQNYKCGGGGNYNPPLQINRCGDSKTVALIASQYYTAGSVTVQNDGNNIYVTYTTTGSWKLKELQLYVGNCTTIPRTNSGNPVPGLFPYKKTFNGTTTNYTFTIPMTNLNGCICVAAHAIVKHSNINCTQTAWGQGVRFVPQGNWGMRFDYCLQECAQEQGCTFAVEHWIFDQVEWGSVTIGGHNYTPSDLVNLYYTSGGLTRSAVLYIAAIKLTTTNITTNVVVPEVNTLENHLSGLGKITPAYMPDITDPVPYAAYSFISSWVINNPCD